jgi:hypothetical protein
MRCTSSTNLLEEEQEGKKIGNVDKVFHWTYSSFVLPTHKETYKLWILMQQKTMSWQIFESWCNKLMLTNLPFTYACHLYNTQLKLQTLNLGATKTNELTNLWILMQQINAQKSSIYICMSFVQHTTKPSNFEFWCNQKTMSWQIFESWCSKLMLTAIYACHLYNTQNQTSKNFEQIFLQQF